MDYLDPLRKQTRMARAIRSLRMTRDILVILIGVIVMIALPPSVDRIGAATFANLAFSVVPLVGGIVCLIGLVRGLRTTEVVGTFTVASGFVVWTAAVLLSPVTTLASYAVAAAFACLALSFIIRGADVAAGLTTIYSQRGD